VVDNNKKRKNIFFILSELFFYSFPLSLFIFVYRMYETKGLWVTGGKNPRERKIL